MVPPSSHTDNPRAAVFRSLPIPVTHVSRRPGGVTLQPVTPFGSLTTTSVKLNPSNKREKNPRGKSTCLPWRCIPFTRQKRLRASTREERMWCSRRRARCCGSLQQRSAVRARGQVRAVLLLPLLPPPPLPPPLRAAFAAAKAPRRSPDSWRLKKGGIPSQITSKHTRRAHRRTHRLQRALSQTCLRFSPGLVSI